MKQRLLRLKTFKSTRLSVSEGTGSLEEIYEAWRKTLKEEEFVSERLAYAGGNYVLVILYIG